MRQQELDAIDDALAQRQRDDDMRRHHPELHEPNAHVHPVFAGILNSHAFLGTADDKRAAKRFTGDGPTGFGDLPPTLSRALLAAGATVEVGQ